MTVESKSLCVRISVILTAFQHLKVNKVKCMKWTVVVGVIVLRLWLPWAHISYTTLIQFDYTLNVWCVWWQSNMPFMTLSNLWSMYTITSSKINRTEATFKPFAALRCQQTWFHLLNGLFLYLFSLAVFWNEDCLSRSVCTHQIQTIWMRNEGVSKTMKTKWWVCVLFCGPVIILDSMAMSFTLSRGYDTNEQTHSHQFYG